MRTTLPVLALALALALAGCIQNMADLKDRVDAESVESASVAADEAASLLANETRKPPVARVTIFGASNARLYTATFQADDVETPIMVPGGVELTFISADSEARVPGAKIASIVWTIQGNSTSGPKATTTLPEPGVYPVVLNVTDSLGASDEQRLVLGVMPEPFTVVTNLTTKTLAGARGNGDVQTLPFQLDTAAAGVPATVQAVQVVVMPSLACDVTLAFIAPDGTPVGKANDAGATSLDKTETLTFGPLPMGAYVIAVTPDACAEPEGVPVSVTVTYLESIPGLTDGGEGEGAHAGH